MLISGIGMVKQQSAPPPPTDSSLFCFLEDNLWPATPNKQKPHAEKSSPSCSTFFLHEFISPPSKRGKGCKFWMLFKIGTKTKNTNQNLQLFEVMIDLIKVIYNLVLKVKLLYHLCGREITVWALQLILIYDQLQCPMVMWLRFAVFLVTLQQNLSIG